MDEHDRALQLLVWSSLRYAFDADATVHLARRDRMALCGQRVGPGPDHGPMTCPGCQERAPAGPGWLTDHTE